MFKAGQFLHFYTPIFERRLKSFKNTETNKSPLLLLATSCLLNHTSISFRYLSKISYHLSKQKTDSQSQHRGADHAGPLRSWAPVIFYSHLQEMN